MEMGDYTSPDSNRANDECTVIPSDGKEAVTAGPADKLAATQPAGKKMLGTSAGDFARIWSMDGTALNLIFFRRFRKYSIDYFNSFSLDNNIALAL